MSTLIEKLTLTFRDVFEDETLQLTTDTTARDVLGWDSLQHVTLILAVERRFAVRFTSAEVAHLQSIGDMIALLHKKGVADT